MKTNEQITVTREENTGLMLITLPLPLERRFERPQDAADWLELHRPGSVVHWNLTTKQP